MKTNIISSDLALVKFKTIVPRFLIAVALISFALAPPARAVVPPPDGGYSGGNTAEGQNALFSLTTGGYNTAVGFLSLRSDTSGGLNTAVGAGALFGNTGDENTAIGLAAGLKLTTGSRNICIGSSVQGLPGESNTIRIGDNLPTGPALSGCYIGGIYGQNYGFGALQVWVNSNGKIGTALSSRRFKRDIKPLENASEAILSLKPVTFRYTNDATNTPCFGLIAEEVAKVNPDLVIRDKNGELLSVRYDQVNAMLLNEFLKEHRKVEEQGRKVQEQERAITQLKSTTAKQEVTIAQLKSTVTHQQKAMEAVTACLEKQTSQIQKASAQLEINKQVRPQMVINNP